MFTLSLTPIFFFTYFIGLDEKVSQYNRWKERSSHTLLVEVSCTSFAVKNLALSKMHVPTDQQFHCQNPPCRLSRCEMNVEHSFKPSLHGKRGKPPGWPWTKLESIHVVSEGQGDPHALMRTVCQTLLLNEQRKVANQVHG